MLLSSDYRRAQAGCVEAVMKQEEECFKKLGVLFRQISTAVAIGTSDERTAELQRQIVQAFYIREQNLLGLAELLQGSEVVYDTFFGEISSLDTLS